MSRARDGLYRRDDSSVWWMSYIDASGRRRRKSTKETLKSRAQAVLDRARAQASMGDLPAEGRAKVKDVEPKYLEAMEAAGQRNLRGKREHFSTWLTKLFGDVQLRQLGAPHVEQLRLAMRKKKRKPGTINRVTGTLRHMVTWSHRMGLCGSSVRDRLRDVPQLKENNTRTRHLSPKEVKTLLKHCEEPLKSVVLVALYTGARQGELIGNSNAEPLKWSEVDFENGLITFARTKSGRVRHVPISDPLRKVLTALPRHLDSDFVFWTERKVNDEPVVERLNWSKLRKGWEKALEDAKIEDFRFHDLRHTAASLMVSQGVPIYTVQAVLGHADTRTTGRYSHLVPDDLRPAMEHLAAIGHVLVTSEKG